MIKWIPVSIQRNNNNKRLIYRVPDKNFLVDEEENHRIMCIN